MEQDERLLPLPNARDLQTVNQNEPTHYAPIYDDEFDGKRSLREYFNVVYKRLPIILAMTLVTTAVVAFYMYRQLTIFEARTEMIIEPRKPKVQDKEGVNINFGNDVNYYNTQLKLLQNPELMNEVVVSLNLHREPNLFNNQNRSFFSTVGSMISSDKADQSKESTLPVLSQTDDEQNNAGKIALTPEEKRRAQEYAAILLGGMRVVQTPGTNLVNIYVQSTNQALAAKTADMVGKVFIKQDIDRETQGGKKALDDLTKSIEELKGTIDGQELELIKFMSSNSLPLQEKGGELSAGILQNLSSQWLSAIDDRRKIEARYTAAVRANERGEGQSIQDLTEAPIYQQTVRLNIERRAKLQDTIREIDRQISSAETEKAQLKVTYTDEYSKVKEKDEQIAKLKETKDKTEKEVTQIIEREQQKIETDAISGALVGLRSQLEAAQGRENQLRATYLNEVSSANVRGQAETRLTTLKREIETSRGLLDTYTQKQKQMELTIAGSEPDNLKISSLASTPEPIGPNRNRNIFVAFLISLAGGIGLAFLLDYLDDSVKTSDDIGRHLGLPTLAMIPYTGESERRKISLIPSKTGEVNHNSTALAALEDNRSATAEAYRHLRTSLLFSSAGKPPQTILITSSQPAEGKTTTAINTAITLAKSGVEVAIIDCDLRRPRLHKHFGVANVNGLTSYLSGDRNPSSLLQACPGLPNLKVITSGPIPPNPAELLSSNEMKNLLQYLKGDFKHVIIDSPPSVFFTDAAILSMIVDGVVIVALAGKSSIHLTRRFKQRLGSIGARIYGVVLNGIKSNSAEYSYYGYNYATEYYTSNKDDDSTPWLEDEVVFTDEDDRDKK